MTKRITANPAAQSFGMGGPFTIYEDIWLRCRRCLVIFLFSAHEQQRWYEALRFTVDSWPTACPACRHFYRRLKGAHAFLARAQHSPTNIDATVLGEMAVIFAHLGRSTKATTFLRRAIKRTADPEVRVELEQAVERATAAPELLERAVPDLFESRDRQLLIFLFEIAVEAYRQRSPNLLPAARAALERVHQNRLGTPANLFGFKRELIAVANNARGYLQTYGKIALGDIWTNRWVLQSALLLIYQRIGNLHSEPVEELDAADELLIDSLSTVWDWAEPHIAQQELATRYPVEPTRWGGFLVPV